MFKKLKKWYFKIYHLFKLIGIFIIIFGSTKKVYAEECSFLYDSDKLLVNGNFTTYIYSSEDGENIFNFTPDPTKTYILYALNNNNEEVTLCDNTISGGRVLNSISIQCATNPKNIVITNANLRNVPIFRFQINDVSPGNANISALQNRRYIFKEGSEICIPSNEENEKNEVYSNFLTLYTDRLNYLANGFTENPYLLAMIGIIFSFVVLELFLKILHLRGGKYK